MVLWVEQEYKSQSAKRALNGIACLYIAFPPQCRCSECRSFVYYDRDQLALHVPPFEDETELSELSTTYRRRLDVVGFCTAMSTGNHTLNVVAFYIVGKMLFPAMTTTLAQHFLMVPLTLFTMAVPLPFGALGISELVAVQIFNLVGHPGGDLAMMGFRVLMYGGGLVGACGQL